MRVSPTADTPATRQGVSPLIIDALVPDVKRDSGPVTSTAPSFGPASTAPPRGHSSHHPASYSTRPRVTACCAATWSRADELTADALVCRGARASPRAAPEWSRRHDLTRDREMRAMVRASSSVRGFGPPIARPPRVLIEPMVDHLAVSENGATGLPTSCGKLSSFIPTG